MKKYGIIFSLCSLFSITSCFNNFTIPSKYEVSTSAKYNFTIADVDFSLSEYFSPSSFISNSSDTSLFSILDYNPNGNQIKQKYLIRMAIQEIPLDLSSYLGGTDFGNLISSMNFEQNVSIPDFSLNKTIDLDVSVLNDAVNQLVTFAGPVTGGNTMQNVLFSEGFNSLVYENGILEINADTDGRVNLYSGPDESNCVLISSATITGNKASLNISGKKMYKGCSKICFENAGTSFTAKITDDSKILYAEGLSFNNLEIPEIPIDVPFANPNSPLLSCIIGDGTIECKLNTPSSWTGISKNQNINFNGGITYNLTSENGSLTNVEISNDDIHVKANYELSFVDSYIDFSSSPTVSFNVKVNQIKEAVVKLPEGTNTSINVNQALPEEASTMIDEIDWKAGCGIKIKYTNSFPIGNDFSLSNVESTFLGLEGQPSKSLESQTTNGQVEFLTTEVKQCLINNSTRIDFRANLALPGGATDKITVKDVVPGQSYKVKLEITPVLDWDKLLLKSSLTNISGSKSVDFNLNTIFQSLDTTLGCDFSSKIQFTELPIHIFSEIPNLSGFSSPSFNGKIKLNLQNSAGVQIGSDEVYLLGSSTENGVMPSAREPVLTKDENNTVISTVSGGLNANLAPIINASSSHPDSKLAITYNIGLTTGSSSNLEISHDSLLNNENTTIKLVAYIIIPLEFSLLDDVDIDIMGIVGSSMDRTDPNWDVLKRTEPTSVDGISKFLNAVESVKISYSPTKKPFISSSDIRLCIDMDGVGTNFSENVLSLSGGNITENPNNLLTVFPLQPDVKLELEKGTISVPRDIGIKSKIDLGINMSGEPITIFGDN